MMVAEQDQALGQDMAPRDFALHWLWLSGAALRVTILAMPPGLPRITADPGLNASGSGLLTGVPSLIFGLRRCPARC